MTAPGIAALDDCDYKVHVHNLDYMVSLLSFFVNALIREIFQKNVSHRRFFTFYKKKTEWLIAEKAK